MSGPSLADLPFGDRSVDRLDDATRARVVRHWERRAQSEYRVGRCFAELWPRLRDVGGSAAAVVRCRDGADEETRHAELCLRLADAYRGAPGAVAFAGATLPSFGCDEPFEVLLLVASASCINETVAIGWLSACLQKAETPLARAANRVHLREEMEHARFGWAHLASSAVSAEMKADLAAWLVPILEANVPRWHTPDPDLPETGVHGHGLLSQQASVLAIDDAVEHVVIPGFAHVGIDVTAAREWFAGTR